MTYCRHSWVAFLFCYFSYRCYNYGGRRLLCIRGWLVRLIWACRRPDTKQIAELLLLAVAGRAPMSVGQDVMARRIVVVATAGV